MIYENNDVDVGRDNDDDNDLCMCMFDFICMHVCMFRFY